MDLETKDYGFFEVKLVGTDETEIVIGSSLESVKAEMEDTYGEMLDTVTQVSGDELASGDPVDSVTQHKNNISILTGRNPFAESTQRFVYVPESKKNKPKEPSTALQKFISKKKSKQEVEEGSGGDFRMAADRAAMTKRDTNKNPQNKDQVESVEEESLLHENEDKLMYLIRIGLMNRNEMILVRRAMQLRKSNAPMSKVHRDILFKLLDKMLGLVMKNPHMYNIAKRKIMHEAWEEIFEEIKDKELVESYIAGMDYIEEKQGPCWKGYKKVPGKKDYEDGSCVKEEDEELEEAGYMDPPTTSSEVKKKYPNTETDVKNKNSKDLQTLKYK